MAFALTEHDPLGRLLASAGLFSRTLPHEAFALTEHDPLGRLLASAGPFGHLLPHEAFALTEHDPFGRLLASAGLFSRKLPHEAVALTEHDPLGRLLASAGPFGRLLPHEAFALTEHDPFGRHLASTGPFGRLLPHEAFALAEHDPFGRHLASTGLLWLQVLTKHDAQDHAIANLFQNRARLHNSSKIELHGSSNLLVKSRLLRAKIHGLAVISVNHRAGTIEAPERSESQLALLAESVGPTKHIRVLQGWTASIANRCYQIA